MNKKGVSNVHVVTKRIGRKDIGCENIFCYVNGSLFLVFKTNISKNANIPVFNRQRLLLFAILTSITQKWVSLSSFPLSCDRFVTVDPRGLTHLN